MAAGRLLQIARLPLVSGPTGIFRNHAKATALLSLNLLSNTEDCFKHFTLKCQNNWWLNTSHVRRREWWVASGGRDTGLNWLSAWSVRKTHKQRCGTTVGAKCNHHSRSHTYITCPASPPRRQSSEIMNSSAFPDINRKVMGLLHQPATCVLTQWWLARRCLGHRCSASVYLFN